MPTPCIRSARRLAVCLLVFVCLGLLPAAAQAAKRSQASSDTSVATGEPLDYARGEVLVTFEPDMGEFEAAMALDEAGRVMSRAADFAFDAQDAVQVQRSHRNLARGARGEGARRYLVRTQMDARRAARLLSEQPGVASASPNYLRRMTAAEPDDPFWTNGDLWNLAAINAASGWSGVTQGTGPEVVIAVLDTGVDYTHEDLAGVMWVNPGEIAGDGIDNDLNGFVDDIHGVEQRTLEICDELGENCVYPSVQDGDPMDNNGHGTHVAGIAAAQANNGLGIPGVAYPANVKIMALKFLDHAGWGYDDDAIALIEYAVDMKLHHNVNIVAINASWGGAGYNPALEQAIVDAGAAGIVFVAAAGNQGFNNDCEPHYPGSYPLNNVISVAASDRDDRLAVFSVATGAHSNQGLVAVDLAAPGQDVFSSFPGVDGLAPHQDGDLLYDDFASPLNAAWSLEGDWANVELGDPASWCISHEVDTGYGDDVDESVSWTQNLDLSEGGPYRLVFQARADLEEDFDFLLLEFTTDDPQSPPEGGVTWEAVYGVTGDTQGWVNYSVPITDAYCKGQLHFRFRFVSDGSNPEIYTGASIEAVAVVSGADSDVYEALSGTSMATPHVTGAVAVLSAKYPELTVDGKVGHILAGCSYPLAQDNPMDLAETVGAGGLLDLGRVLDSGVAPAPLLMSASRWEGGAAHPELAVGEGDSVVLRGVGFGASQGQALFSHGNAPGTASGQITSWSDSQIVCTVPQNAGGHVHVVSAGGAISGKQRLSSWRAVSAMATPRDTFASTVLDGKIYVTGGFDNSLDPVAVWDSIEVYTPAAGSWSTLETPLPFSRASHAAAALNGKLYLIGGYHDDDSMANEYLTSVQAYDPVGDSWSEVASLTSQEYPTSGLMWHAAAAVGNNIWVTGGAYHPGYLDDHNKPAKAQSSAVSYFTPANGAIPGYWAPSVPMSELREGHAMVAVGTKLYVFGGGYKTDPAYENSPFILLDSCEVLDTANLSAGWRQLPPMPLPMARMAAATDGEMIYLVGGTDQEWWHGTPARRMLVFDIASETWEYVDHSLVDARTARNAPSMAFVSGQGLYLMGGMMGGDTLNDCELFKMELPVVEPEESDILMFIPGIIAASHR